MCSKWGWFEILGLGSWVSFHLCDRIWEKGPFRAKRVFLPFFKLSPFQGLESPRLLAWFISSLDLLLHRSNVRSLSKPPVLSGEPPKWGIKRRFSNAIDVRGRPTHTGSGRGPQLAPSVDGWLKNIHARFEVHSCYGSRDISVLKWKFGKCAEWSLFSYPVTYYTVEPLNAAFIFTCNNTAQSWYCTFWWICKLFYMCALYLLGMRTM